MRLAIQIISCFLMASTALSQQTVGDWQREAVKQYPELGREGAPMNKLFISRFKTLQASSSPTLNDPKWPMLLARECSDELSDSIIPGLKSPDLASAKPTVSDALQAPPTKPPTYVRNKNGILYDLYPDSKAFGTLSISNGTEHNAIVKLIDIATNRKVLSFYVRANSDQKISAIPDGNFRLIFAYGDEIIVGSPDKFYHPFGYTKFESLLDFTTTELYDRTQYATFEITLQPVIDGNAKIASISADEYDQY